MVFFWFIGKSSKSSKGESSSKVSVLTSRKCSSTSSLPEATESNNMKPSVASTEQASSADSLLVSKVRKCNYCRFVGIDSYTNLQTLMFLIRLQSQWPNQSCQAFNQI